MTKRLLPLLLLLLGAAAVLAADDPDRGYLGISLAHVIVHDADAHADGVFVQRVYAGSGAANAGLAADDRLLSIDGREIADMADIEAALEGSRQDQPVTVRLRRGDEELTTTVVLGARPAPAQIHRASIEAHDGTRWAVVFDGGGKVLGLRVQPLGRQLAEYFGVDGGLLVSEVIDGTPAADAGMQAGDVVTAVEGRRAGSVAELHRWIGEAEVGDEMQIEVRRRGSPLTFYVAVAELPEQHDVGFHSPSFNFNFDFAFGEGVVQGEGETTIEILHPEQPARD